MHDETLRSPQISDEEQQYGKKSCRRLVAREHLNITKLYTAPVIRMDTFEAMPKQWGSSLGIVIPKGLVHKERLSAKKKVWVIVISDEMEGIRRMFGTLKSKKPTQQIMDEIDEGYD